MYKIYLTYLVDMLDRNYIQYNFYISYIIICITSDMSTINHAVSNIWYEGKYD